MKGFRLWLSTLLVLVLAACGQGSVKSPDFSSELISISITPSGTLSIGQGESIQFSASGVRSSQPGQPPVVEPIDGVEWSSSNPAVVSVSATGLAIGGATPGTVTITATKGKVKGTVQVTNEGLVLRELIITPSPVILGPGQSATVLIQGRYSDSQTPRDLPSTQAINWQIDGNLATIITNPPTGKSIVVRGGNVEGLTTLRAVLQGQTGALGSKEVQVIVGRIESLSIEPATASSPIGIPKEFKAVAHFAVPTGGGSLPDADVAATWTASTTAPVQPTLADACAANNNASVKCIITGRSEGTVNITAAYAFPNPNDPNNPDVPTATATLTVTPAILTAISIQSADTPPLALLPGSLSNPSRQATVGRGAAPRFQASYSYSDGVTDTTPRALEDQVDWAISDTSGNLATISVDQNTNIATVQAKAQTPANAPVILSATVTDAIKDSIRITIGNALPEAVVAVRPSRAYVALGRALEFVAVGRYSDGSTSDLADNLVTWSTADSTVVTSLTANGVATASNVPAKVGSSTKVRATFNANNTFAEGDFVITSSRCNIPLLGTDNAQAIENPIEGICLLCGTNNLPRVVDASAITFGQINTGISALNGNIGINVKIDPSASYMPLAGGQRPGFIVSLPKGPLVLAEALKQLQIETLQYTGSIPAVVESSSDLIPLRVDLLGLEVVDLNGDLIPDEGTAGSEQTQYIVTMSTSLPFNGIRLKVKSGTATALSTVNVFQACANSETVAPTLNGIGSIETEPVLVGNTGVVGQSITFIAKNLDGVVFPNAGQNQGVPLVTWTSSNTAVAPNPDGNGRVTPAGVGTTTITAELVDKSQCTSACTATYTLHVIQNYCEAPFVAPPATVSSDNEGLCVLCNVSSLANVIDAAGTRTAAIVNVPVGLLNGGVAIRVNSNAVVPFPSGQRVGFVVRRSTGALLTAEVLSQLEFRTLLDGVVKETFTQADLNVDLLTLPLLDLGNPNQIFGQIVGLGDGVTTSQPFNSVELVFKSGVASALSQLEVYSACPNITAPLPQP